MVEQAAAQFLDMNFSMEKKHTEPSAERATLEKEINNGCEMAQDGRTSLTYVLFTVFPDGEAENDNVMDDRTYSAAVAKGAILSKIDELSRLEEDLRALERHIDTAA